MGLPRTKADLQQAGKSLTDENISQQLYQNYYNQAFNDPGLGTGGNVQRAITAATAAIQALSGGDIKTALAGGTAPYIANEIGRNITDQNTLAGIMAHAAVNAALAKVQGQNAAVGAAGAAVGETSGILIAKEVYGKDPASLTEQEKQTVSALATLASGLAGGLIGNSTETAVQAGIAGKTTVENNSMSELVPPRVQQDASLAFDPSQQGKSTEEISDAIDVSHLGPSWGTEYKVKPNGKIEVSGGPGVALKGGAEINNDYFSISTGYTKEFGAKTGASIGVDLGPYVPGLFGDLNRDYSTSIGFGPGSMGVSAGKDGIGFSFSVGPSIGFTGSSKDAHGENIDLNGDSTKEIYHHDFK